MNRPTYQQRRAVSLSRPGAAIAYGQRRTPLRGYGRTRFPLPYSGMGCAGCKRPTLGGNTATLTWYNGQVLTFDLDDPAQKSQYEAIRRQLTTQPSVQPTTTIIYGSSALTPPTNTQVLTALLPLIPQPQPAAAQTSWLEQQMISGVPNKWLAGAALGFVALASLRKGKR